MSTGVSAGVLDEHLAALRKRFSSASIQNADGGAMLVTIPGVVLPPGWNQGITTVRFLAPAGYPMARPDCFWADPSLRLENGGMPQNGALNVIPGLGGEPHMWFSWHLQSWEPANDTLVTFLRTIQRRFAAKN